MGRGKSDILSVVERVYDFDGNDASWIQRIADATESAVGVGVGTVGLLYEVDASNTMHARTVVETKRARGFAALAKQVIEEGVNASYVETSFRVIPCAMASTTPNHAQTSFHALFNPVGVRDMLGINGVDPAGIGAFIGVATPTKMRLTRDRQEMLSRVSAHIAAGYRLRRRLRTTPSDGEAILAPNGRVEHAVGEAQLRAARDLLKEATCAIERARGRMRRNAPDEAIAMWRGLVSARWTLVDHFERSGKRYVVAQRNEAGGHGPEALTPRERQVVSFVVLGHTTKHIAYELGLSDTTVRVLIARAHRKLGTTKRHELARALAHAAKR